MKINPRMFTDIKAILPGFSSITGCDTAYYSFGVGQIGPFKKLRRLGKMDLLQDMGTHAHSFKRLDKTFSDSVMSRERE